MLRGARSVSSICAITLERSRMLPSLSARPGFSRPGGPYLSSLIRCTLLDLEADAAVDEDRLARHERRFVGDKVHEGLGDFLRRRKPPHRLARDEVLARFLRVGEGVDAIAEGGRVHGAGADAIHA